MSATVESSKGQWTLHSGDGEFRPFLRISPDSSFLLSARLLVRSFLVYTLPFFFFLLWLLLSLSIVNKP